MLFNLYFSKKPKNQKPKNLTMPTMYVSVSQTFLIIIFLNNVRNFSAKIISIYD